MLATFKDVDTFRDPINVAIVRPDGKVMAKHVVEVQEVCLIVLAVLVIIWLDALSPRMVLLVFVLLDTLELVSVSLDVCPVILILAL